MPPVRRGDLYRDRLLGFRVFVVLDGVFGQELAISPREAIDVARDGGLVVGASSMGAMRAAECWPAGVEGVGAVYRLFRRGALTSDAEVALAFSPEPPYHPVSVPLINVRYALSRCMRDRILSRPLAERLLRSATGMFYSDRTWALMFKSSAVSDPHGELLAALSGHDLKRLDAIRALRAVRRRLAGCPHLSDDDGAVTGLHFRMARPREEPHDANAIAQSNVAIRGLWQWLVATGRYRRYGAAALGSEHGRVRRGGAARSRRASGRGRTGTTALPGSEREWMKELGIKARDVKSAIESSRTSERLARRLTREDAPLARAIWADIFATGERDALVCTFAATMRAAAWARRCNLGGDTGLTHAVTSAIAHAHGYAGWYELQAALLVSPVWPWIERAVEDTVLARRVRRELFASAREPGQRLNLQASQEWGTP
jgi:hypothetical protein